MDSNNSNNNSNNSNNNINKHTVKSPSLSIIKLLQSIDKDDFSQLKCLKGIESKINYELNIIKSKSIEKKIQSFINNGENIFITGYTGTGKTYLLNNIIKYIKNKNTYVCSSTGISSILLDEGITLYSYIGLGFLDENYDYYIESFYKTISGKKIIKDNYHKFLIKKYKNTDIIIIDEISTLSANVLVILDKLLKHFRDNLKSFGGVQIICSGDFLEFSSISKFGERKYCFGTETWVNSKFKIIKLCTTFRHNRNEFLDILNMIRNGNFSNNVKIYLSKLKYHSIESIHIYSTNKEVNQLNNNKLSKINEIEHVYDISFKFFNFPFNQLIEYQKGLKISMFYKKPLKLKIGSQVIFTRNNYRKYIKNGTLGIITSMKAKNNILYPIVRIKITNSKFMYKDVYCVPKKYTNIISKTINKPESWVEYSYIPLRIAYALRINKIQGMTLKHITLHIDKFFCPGQLYTALSKVKTYKDIDIIGEINYIKLSETILKCYNARKIID